VITLFSILSCVCFLVLSAFFSAAETALVSLSPQKVKSLSVGKPDLAQTLQSWLLKPHELLILILIGNTLVNVLFAAVSTAFAVHLFPNIYHSAVEVAAWALGTACLVILGEMAPKFFARANPERTSLFVLPLLSWLRNRMNPFFNFISSFTGWLAPRWQTRPVGQLMTFSMEELKLLLEENQAAAGLPDESVSMMHKILEINNRRAEAIMTPIDQVDVVELDPPGKSAPDRDRILDLIVEQGHTRTPLKKGGAIVGTLHSDDLLPFIIQDRKDDLLSLVRQPLSVPAETGVNELLQQFRKSGVYIGLVTKDAAVVGLITLEDVLEEVTGEILDEYDVSHPAEKS